MHHWIAVYSFSGKEGYNPLFALMKLGYFLVALYCSCRETKKASTIEVIIQIESE